jgi:uncharacterized protein (TIGR00369 family)
MEGKRVKESRVTLSQMMLPQDANPMGNIHGGIIMKLADEAGGLCAMRHSQRQVVTVAIDSMTFHSPVYVGNLVTLNANLNWVGRSSMEVEVCVTAEDPLSGRHTHTNTAFVVLVALDDKGRPTKVPLLILETDEERRRWTEAEKRQQRRLKR